MRTKQKRLVCVLLPNKQHLDCTVTVRSKGRDVWSSVLRHHGVSELQVFGLAVLRDNEYLFVDLEQKLSKYFGKTWARGSLMVPFILFLRVQYYLESGLLIMSSKAQQLYYTELREKALRSQSPLQEPLFFQLAASALQAEVGDLDDEKEDEGEGEEKRQERKQQRRRYFLPEDYFPSWLIKRRGRDFLLQHGPVLHAELRGMTRGQAILQFIKEAASLEDAPITFYRLREEKKELKSSILLGVALKGVHIYQEVEGKRCPLYVFSWTDIDRLTFQSNRFEISVVGSLCLPKLVYYAHSAFHSKHILRHLTDSHRLHIHTRGALGHIQRMEDMRACQFYKEAYICDTTRLTHRLRNNSLASSVSDHSATIDPTTAGCKREGAEEEDRVSFIEYEMCVDESEELLVDDPADVLWLDELLHRGSACRSLALRSPFWAAVTMEMKQVLRVREDPGVSVD